MHFSLQALEWPAPEVNHHEQVGSNNQVYLVGIGELVCLQQKNLVPEADRKPPLNTVSVFCSGTCLGGFHCFLGLQAENELSTDQASVWSKNRTTCTQTTEEPEN